MRRKGSIGLPSSMNGQRCGDKVTIGPRWRRGHRRFWWHRRLQRDVRKRPVGSTGNCVDGSVAHAKAWVSELTSKHLVLPMTVQHSPEAKRSPAMVDERDASPGRGSPGALPRPAEAAASAPGASAVPLARAEKNRAAAVAPSSPLGAPRAPAASAWHHSEQQLKSVHA
jgi:hypothetical protein